MKQKFTLHHLLSLLGLPIQRAGWNMNAESNWNETKYRETFERLWDAQSGQPVSNGQPAHAAALISVFLSRAEHKVVIFCKELRKDVYDTPDVLIALEGAIGRGIELEVLVQQKAPQDSKFADMLRAAVLGGECKVSLQEELPQAIAKYPINFAYVDDRAYRFEKNRDDVSAVASAWGLTTVRLLQTLYGQIKVSLGHANSSATSAGI